MKRLLISFGLALMITLFADYAFAISYCQDFLEAGNPGGPYAGLKTYDVVNPEIINPGDTFVVDIWAGNLPESLLSSGFLMNYDPTQVSIVSVEAYDGADRAGPWDGDATFKAAEASGPGSYLVTLLQLSCAVPDSGGDVIMARITFRCLAAGSTGITVQPVSAGDFETTIGCNSGTNYDPDMGTGILYLTQETGQCASDQECDDGIYCNGAETCNSVTGICLPGTPVDCADGIDCTEDSCSESAGSCIHIPDSTLCDDGQYCNGTEVCDPMHGCQADTPVTCSDDGLFCNGTESCDEATDSCISSGNPCAPPETCYEEVDHCWIGCIADDDCDGICNPGESYPPGCSGSDNCPTTFNPLQEDSYPPQGNGIGDACDCEGNFNCHEDVDVDGTDAFSLKAHFGRSTIFNPCTNESPCDGDFDCDHDCDGSDAARFKQDYGRSSIQNPCPACEFGVEWCRY